MSEDRSGPGTPARTTPTTAQLSPNGNPEGRQQQLRRRRAAAQRLPLWDCGCADPWGRHSRHGGDVTPALVAGYADAVRLLDELGYPAAPLLPELRAAWRRGDRELVASVTTRWAVG